MHLKACIIVILQYNGMFIVYQTRRCEVSGRLDLDCECPLVTLSQLWYGPRMRSIQSQCRPVPPCDPHATYHDCLIFVVCAPTLPEIDLVRISYCRMKEKAIALSSSKLENAGKPNR